MFSCGGGRHGGGGLDEGGGHLRRHGRGAGRAGGGNVAHQTHAPVDPDVRVSLRRHVQHLQPVVVEARELALKRPPAVRAADRDGGLRVEDR